MKIVDKESKTNLPRWFNGVSIILKNMRCGSLEIILPDNRNFIYQGIEKGPKGIIFVKNNDFFSRLVREGENGFPESYMDGWWDTPDLLTVLDVIFLNNKEIGYSFPGGFLLRNYERLVHWWHSNSKKQAKKNISYHYDLGNEFYSHWLDNTMSYSSALFTDFGEELEVGQNRKYQRLAKALKLKEGDQVLEIGCGWGGFAEIAAKEYKCNVVGITLSNEQAKFAQRRMKENQLSNLVDIRIEDYRDVQGSFDKIVSIEMFEAVGEEHWRNYFETIKTRLKPGGLAGIQSITIANEFFETYKRRPDFIQKYIFPGGILPSEDKLNNAVSSAGLKILDDYYFGKSYAETLRRWQSTFEQKWDDIKNLGFDEKFQKMWRYYLSYCEAGFETGHINVGQFLIGSK